MRTERQLNFVGVALQCLHRVTYVLTFAYYIFKQHSFIVSSLCYSVC